VTEGTPAAAHPGDELLRVAEEVHAGEVSVAFRPGPTVPATVGAKLLDIAEASQVAMESGCRMGMCGSDPVRVLEGAENLSPKRGCSATGRRSCSIAQERRTGLLWPRSPVRSGACYASGRRIGPAVKSSSHGGLNASRWS
jgi:ferredoxin